MIKPRKLKHQTLLVRAPPELTYQVVASAGRLVEDRGQEKIVDFETQVGERKVVTRELVRLDPPRRIEYEWLRGPLPHVVEEIEVRPEGDDSRLIYRGEYATARGPWRCLVGIFWVYRVFNRLVLEHLEQAKALAEKRASKSRVFPPKVPRPDQP